MRRSLSLIPHYVKYNLMAAMEFRTAFLLQAVGMAINDLVLVFFWAVFFTQFPPIQGWGLRDTLTIYALMAAGFGLAHIVCGNTFHVANIIATGGLDYYLALPFDTLTHLLISRMDFSAWGDLVFGLLLALALRPGDAAAFGLFLVGMLCFGIILVAFSVVAGSLAFYIGSADSVALQLIQGFVQFATYPADIFPNIIRVILYTLVPAALASTLPASLVRDFDAGRMALMLAATLAMALLARVVFTVGLRRYESGNLLVVRA